MNSDGIKMVLRFTILVLLGQGLGCQSSGTNSDLSPNEPVRIRGIADNVGPVVGAPVSVYTIDSLSGEPGEALGSTITNEQGEYTLDLAKTIDSPLLIEVGTSTRQLVDSRFNFSPTKLGPLTSLHEEIPALAVTSKATSHVTSLYRQLITISSLQGSPKGSSHDRIRAAIREAYSTVERVSNIPNLQDAATLPAQQSINVGEYAQTYMQTSCVNAGGQWTGTNCDFSVPSNPTDTCQVGPEGVCGFVSSGNFSAPNCCRNGCSCGQTPSSGNLLVCMGSC